jgi:error-prone DNA polymerase
VLFGSSRVEYDLPTLEQRPKQDLYDELELLGLTTENPFELLDEEATGIRAKDLPISVGKTVELVGWYVAHIAVRIVKGEMMHFGCWMDAESNLFDTVHFPSYPETLQFRGGGFCQLSGLVLQEFG